MVGTVAAAALVVVTASVTLQHRGVATAACPARPQSPAGKVYVVTANAEEVFSGAGNEDGVEPSEVGRGDAPYTEPDGDGGWEGDDLDYSNFGGEPNHRDLENLVNRMRQTLPQSDGVPVPPDVVLLSEVKSKTVNRLVLKLNQNYDGGGCWPGQFAAIRKNETNYRNICQAQQYEDQDDCATAAVGRETAIVINQMNMNHLVTPAATATGPCAPRDEASGEYCPYIRSRWTSSEADHIETYRDHARALVQEKQSGDVFHVVSVHFLTDDGGRVGTATVAGSTAEERAYRQKEIWTIDIANVLRDAYGTDAHQRLIGGDFNGQRCWQGGNEQVPCADGVQRPFWAALRDRHFVDTVFSQHGTTDAIRPHYTIVRDYDDMHGFRIDFVFARGRDADTPARVCVAKADTGYLHPPKGEGYSSHHRLVFASVSHYSNATCPRT